MESELKSGKVGRRDEFLIQLFNWTSASELLKRQINIGKKLPSISIIHTGTQRSY